MAGNRKGRVQSLKVNCSEAIVEAMCQVEEELKWIDPQSVDRKRLYQRINTAVAANVKMLVGLDDETRRQQVKRISRELLNQEIINGKRQHN